MVICYSSNRKLIQAPSGVSGKNQSSEGGPGLGWTGGAATATRDGQSHRSGQSGRQGGRELHTLHPDAPNRAEPWTAPWGVGSGCKRKT